MASMTSTSVAQELVPDGVRDGYYIYDVNFADLSNQDEEFRALFKASRYRLDFQDPKTLQQLTKSLLKRDFGLDLTLPNDRLCPPVPVRWNYVHWVQCLLDATSDDYSERCDIQRDVLGLDIGVGASCIYALLACASRSEWHMVGTDIDRHSLDWAQRNVDGNGLSERINLKLTRETDPLIPIGQNGLAGLDFVMVNPPFFTSEEDMMATYAKSRPPHAVCTGSTNEMICEGGDIGFVSRIFQESLQLREKVRWYTAMLGKLSSAQQLVARLKEHDIPNFAVTNLSAGQKTRRWAVAWSFSDRRPSNIVARHGDLTHALLPPSTELTIDTPLHSKESLAEKVNAVLEKLDAQWRWTSEKSQGIMETRENVWSRAARRKKKFGETTGEDSAKIDKAADVGARDASERDCDEVALAVKISCSNEKVDLRWLRGRDQLIWTSFCGMLKRSLTQPNA